ncbi:MAG: hypothetical protein ABWZ25_09535 [Chitinophagaceae bacterium]
MKKATILILLAFTCLVSVAQEFKLRKTTGKLLLNISRVIVEGTTGDEIIFQSAPLPAVPSDTNEAGMRVISGAGCSDNTGLGINVVDEKDVLTVCEVLSNQTYLIKVPRGIIISYIGRSTTDSTLILFKNLSNEIEVDTYLNDVTLVDVSGPLTITSVYGRIKVVFNGTIKGPVSITAVHRTVDVSIPSNAKLSLQLRSARNTIMASPELTIKVQHPNNAQNAVRGTYISGTLNGGGEGFRLTSLTGKIYLRKLE